MIADIDWVPAGCIQPTANKTTYLPKYIYGQLVVPLHPNIEIIGHCEETTIYNPYGQGIIVGSGSGNILPPALDGDWPVTGWIDEETFSVDGVPNWVEGDYLWMFPTDKGDPVLAANDFPIGGTLLRVSSVVGDTVTVTYPMPDDFVSEASTVFEGWSCRLVADPAINLGIYNVRCKGRNTGGTSGSAQGLFAMMVDGLRMKNFHTQDHYGQGMYISRCINIDMEQITARNAGAESAGSGYQIEFDQCKDVHTRCTYGETGRPITFSKSAYGFLVEDHTGRHCRAGLIDWHGGFGFGGTWRRIRQYMGANDGNFGNINIETGNNTHRGMILGLRIEDSYVSCIQVKNNCQVHIKNTKLDLIQFASDTPYLEGLPVKLTVENCSNGLSWNPSVIQGTFCADAEITVIGGNYVMPWNNKGLIGASDDTYKMITAGHNVTLNASGVSMVNPNPATPFFNFDGSGTINSTLTNCTFTGGSGTRVVSSAPAMTNGTGTWSGVTVNGIAVGKTAGQINL